MGSGVDTLHLLDIGWIPLVAGHTPYGGSVCGNARTGIIAFIKFLQADEAPILRKNSTGFIHPTKINVRPLYLRNSECVLYVLDASASLER